ncbi:MAG: hypothetical protein K9H61_01735 [Bacteroidia bacterium]|nr:hypothetical protein [Bacteroidia bacterium]MCF8425606.1 hypothetical protein [Bacteroidia bacterium]MCF8445691.1 hypothetical protein [Bacteroidia bacterium]
MRNRKIIGALVILVMAFSSCLKLPNPTEEKPTTPVKFGEIKTDPNFNWTTTRIVDIEVLGLSTRTPIYNTFKLSTKDKASVFYQGKHAMSENIALKITIPAVLDSVLMEFGSIQKTYSVANSKVTIDYIINYPEEE